MNGGFPSQMNRSPVVHNQVIINAMNYKKHLSNCVLDTQCLSSVPELELCVEDLYKHNTNNSNSNNNNIPPSVWND